MQKQISAGEDVSPSSRLLIEDIHQGTTSAAAASTVARYGQFIRAANAPIADMNYSPFTNMKQKIMQEEEHTKAQAINDHFSSQSPGASSRLCDIWIHTTVQRKREESHAFLFLVCMCVRAAFRGSVAAHW